MDRESAYWAHRYTQNLAQVRYSAMIVDIRAHSLEWEEQGAALALQIGALQCGGGAPGQGQAASPPPDALQRLRGDSAPSLRRQIERHAAAVLAPRRGRSSAVSEPSRNLLGSSCRCSPRRGR